MVLYLFAWAHGESKRTVTLVRVSYWRRHMKNAGAVQDPKVGVKGLIITMNENSRYSRRWLEACHLFERASAGRRLRNLWNTWTQTAFIRLYAKGASNSSFPILSGPWHRHAVTDQEHSAAFRRLMLPKTKLETFTSTARPVTAR